MVEKPEDYRWCSYGEAMAPKVIGEGMRAQERAREGYCFLLEERGKMGRQKIQVTGLWKDRIAARYRMMLFADGEEVFCEDINTGVAPEKRQPRLVRKGFKRKEVEQVLAKGGKLSFGEALRCRVRYFSDGMTVGTREFVDEVFVASRERFGPKRKDGARSMRGVGWKKKQPRLYSVRELVKDCLG